MVGAVWALQSQERVCAGDPASPQWRPNPEPWGPCFLNFPHTLTPRLPRPPMVTSLASSRVGPFLSRLSLAAEARVAAAGGSGPPAPTPSRVGAGRAAGRREETVVLEEEGRGGGGDPGRSEAHAPGLRSVKPCGTRPARGRDRLQTAGALPWPFFSDSRPKNPDKRSVAKGQKHAGRQEVVQEAQISAVGARGGERTGESAQDRNWPKMPKILSSDLILDRVHAAMASVRVSGGRTAPHPLPWPLVPWSPAGRSRGGR